MCIKARVVSNKRAGRKPDPEPPESPGAPAAPCVSPALGAALAAALVHHMLACDSAADADAMMLCAKVCAMSRLSITSRSSLLLF